MHAWKELLPETVPKGSEIYWDPYKNSHGYLFSGAGGGFLMVISDTPVDGGFQLQINSQPWCG